MADRDESQDQIDEKILKDIENSNAEASERNPLDEYKATFLRVFLIGILFAVIHFLMRSDLNSTALLYMGIPFILALGITLIDSKKSRMASAMKLLTICLLLSALLLAEGFICIIMAAPILYSVTAIVVALMNRSDRKLKQKNDGQSLQANLMIGLVLCLAFEGTHPLLTVDRNNEITVSKTIPVRIDLVKQTLASNAEITKSKPIFLKIFPSPLSIKGTGLEIGDIRILSFDYKKWIFTNSKKGDIVSKIITKTPNSVTSKIISDDSYIHTYMAINEVKTSYQAISEQQTRVSVTISYKRKLDPSWYFGPMQHYAIWLVGHLYIDNFATPTGKV